jgi:RNA polymerase sigma factor (sigma-70 family)
MNETPDTRMSLLERIGDARDHHAWAEFVSIYEPLVYRLARSRGLQDSDAREITQEAMLAVAGAVGSWEPTAGKGSFRSWLFRIARNLAINFLIKQQRQTRGSGDTDMVRLLHSQPAASSNEASMFEVEYRRQLFRRAAVLIQPMFQENTWNAFWRSCIDDEPIAKVAAELEMSVGSVYAARSRVTAKLSEQVRRLESIE